MRYAVEIAYDGRSFSGWQRQPGRRTVQGEVENALNRLEGTEVFTVGAGRTDAGVHARGQVISFDLSKKWEPGRLLRAMENNLSPEIGIIRVTPVKEDFNARHDAIWREYVYFLWTAPYCFPQVRPFVWRVRTDWASGEVAVACKALPGEHDFGLFCPPSERPANPVRRILRVGLVRRREWVAFRIRATGFLFHMVRNIVGDLNRVADGRLPVEAFMKNLSGDSDGGRNYEMAPASGLSLWRIGYSPSPWE
jgi:tRNA pseudouridine38-40 synthase